VSYYPTIEEDLARAKAILRKGEPTVWERANFTTEVIEALRKASSGTIYGGDIYAAYKLLESFVCEIERLRACRAAIPPERIDHNGECLDCDEQGAHRFDCPWLVAVRAALTP
jgi:hypothetical protein